MKGATERRWWAIASSSDGTTLAAAVNLGNIWTSTDSGGTWTERPVNDHSQNFQGIALSSDGSRLAAVISADCRGLECAGGAIWTSTDGGQTWTKSM